MPKKLETKYIIVIGTSITKITYNNTSGKYKQTNETISKQNAAYFVNHKSA